MVALYVLVPLRLYMSPIGRVRTVDELTARPARVTGRRHWRFHR